MLGVKEIPDGRFIGPGFFPGEHSIRTQVVGSRLRPRERPLALLPPMPSHEDSAVGCLMTVPVAHDEDPDGRLPVHAVVDPLQPSVEPTLPEGDEADLRLRALL